MKKIFALVAATLFVGFNAHALPEGYTGDYAGKFEGRKGTLTISSDGATFSASFKGANGSSDILGGGCNSKIGRMIDIDLDNNDTEVDKIVFDFDAGNCKHQVEGRELTVDFKHSNGKPVSINALIYAYSTYETGWHCYPLPNGGSHCVPDHKYYDWYATGKFKK